MYPNLTYDEPKVRIIATSLHPCEELILQFWVSSILSKPALVAYAVWSSAINAYLLPHAWCGVVELSVTVTRLNDGKHDACKL